MSRSATLLGQFSLDIRLNLTEINPLGASSRATKCVPVPQGPGTALRARNPVSLPNGRLGEMRVGN